MSSPFTRRKFFGGALAVAPLARSLRLLPLEESGNSRSDAALALRQQVALQQSKRPVASMTANGDETSLPDWIACFTKGLPQNRLGEVEPGAYAALLAAMKSGQLADFERIPRGGGRKLNNPQAAFSFHLEGGDLHIFYIQPAPSIGLLAAAQETSELYW